jgi:hypothetical protein
MYEYRVDQQCVLSTRHNCFNDVASRLCIRQDVERGGQAVSHSKPTIRCYLLQEAQIYCCSTVSRALYSIVGGL